MEDKHKNIKQFSSSGLVIAWIYIHIHIIDIKLCVKELLSGHKLPVEIREIFRGKTELKTQRNSVPLLGDFFCLTLKLTSLRYDLYTIKYIQFKYTTCRVLIKVYTHVITYKIKTWNVSVTSQNLNLGLFLPS